jgi:hypothetical protein
MTTQNKAVTCYLPKDIEDFITGYCNEYGITRKDKEGHIYPSLGTGIIELLKLLAYNPELVSSPILDTVPSKFSEDAIEKKIDEILEKKLNSPDTVPSQLPDLDGKVESLILDKLPSMIPEYLSSDLMARIETIERLLRLQQSASITSPLPTGEPSPFPTIGENPDMRTVATVETVYTVETAIESVESVYTVESVYDNVEAVYEDEPVQPAIGPVRGDSPQLNNQLSEAVNIEKTRQGLTNQQLSKKTRVPVSTIEKWKGKIKIGEPIVSKRYPKFFKQWTLNLADSLWYEV